MGSADFEAMWRELTPLGRSAATGGYFRQPFGTAERECQAWFEQQAVSRGLRLERDGNGNTVAWWDAPTDTAEAPERVVSLAMAASDGVSRPQRTAAPERVLTGSHLDSVLDGGAYDGPLGVVSALAAVDELRARGHAPRRSIGVAVFAEEEGSRFGLACLGSRLATGTTTPEQARALRDRDGVGVEDALAATGVEPELGPSRLLDGVDTYLELHVEQGRALGEHPVGMASAIWPHGRYRFDFTGRPDHAGTTRMEDRHDPMLSYAMTVLAANKVARTRGQRATFGRIQVAPNSTNGIASAVTGWLDARAESEAELTAMVADIERQAGERAGRDGTALSVTAESVSGEVRFDADLTGRLADARRWPILPTQAGHDAGILSAAGITSAMLFVRNPTGVSHSPAEHAETADCLAGVAALADVLAELTG